MLVAGAAVEVVSGGAATTVVATRAVKLGLDVVQMAVDKKEDGLREGRTLTMFSIALKMAWKRISRHVYETKEETGNNLSYNYMQAIQDSGHYDIKLSETTIESSTKLSIKDCDKVQTIYRTVMPDIGKNLTGIAGKVGELAVPFAKAIARHESVGIEELGTFSQFQNLADVIASYLDELSEKARLGGKSFEAAVNDIDAQDEASQRALDSIINDIETYTERND